jgi:cytochrome P450
LARHTAREAVLPHGVIPAGARVLLLWASANLDEREFDDPETFDIHRRAARHLALGHGLHFCLGASLARLEARVAFEEWLRRIPDYEVACTPEHIVSSTFHGFEQLPIVFEARI